MKLRSSFGSGWFLAALPVLVLIALGGCDKNTVSLSASASETGSFSASNTADCLPDITLLNQYGKPVSLASLKGEPVLVDFIYTTCPTLCPMLTAKFASVAKLLGHELGSKVRLVSITLDPEHDHPAQLLAYAQSHEANHKGWLFLTGTPGQIERVLALYHIKRQVNPDGSIGHIALGFLLGPDGRQVRQYDALQVPPKIVERDIDRALVARG
jgi:cytochrome oxidase Cu insertion factor (SCO1/SenC/PrrC family)